MNKVPFLYYMREGYLKVAYFMWQEEKLAWQISPSTIEKCCTFPEVEPPELSVVVEAWKW